MISEDVRIQGFDARAFTNLVSLFAPNVVHRHERDPAGSDAPELALDPGAAGPDGSLVVVVSARGTLRKVFHTVHGRVRDLDWRGFGALEGLPERYGARRVVALTEGVLEDAFARASARMHREDDYVAQWLHVVRAIREEMDQGRIVVHPRPFVSVPLPTSQLVRRTLDSVLPDDRAFVLAVWRGPTLWTAAILRRRGGEIDWVAGPDQLLAWTGPLGGDWRRDHRVVSQCVAAHVAPVHLGFYGDLRSVRRLLRSREAGAWAKAVASREVILHPTPPYVAVALGADAVRRVAQKSSAVFGGGLFGGLDPIRQVMPVLGVLRNRVVEVASVTQTLGFDPLKLLAQFLQRVDPDEEEGRAKAAREDDGRYGEADAESVAYEARDADAGSDETGGSFDPDAAYGADEGFGGFGDDDADADDDPTDDDAPDDDDDAPDDDDDPTDDPPTGERTGSPPESSEREDGK
ncbi:MAG: hypothetical protein ACK6CU_04635 [Deltaproteobacteria bacterium]|jgi:hypothetical protein